MRTRSLDASPDLRRIAGADARTHGWRPFDGRCSRDGTTNARGARSSIGAAAATPADAILRARRIVVSGLRREGLVVRAFCLRLMHLGLDAHVAGGVTTPPIGPGDALVVSILPMGTAYEIAMLIFLDLVAVEPRERTRQTMARLRARQYNLG